MLSRQAPVFFEPYFRVITEPFNQLMRNFGVFVVHRTTR
ncbi:hypothetical protein [Klebsiella pneumoniae ISC21]|nr:hypothetical protein [Klebsiella pneumoniae ISC21]